MRTDQNPDQTPPIALADSAETSGSSPSTLVCSRQRSRRNLHEGALQACTRSPEDGEAASCDAHAILERDQSVLFSESDVILGIGNLGFHGE